MSRPRMLAAAVTVSIIAASFVAAPVAAQDGPQPPTATPNPVPFDVPSGDGTAIRLTTDLGDVVIALFNESAPVASENFYNLATSGFYDGVGFHRAVPGFVLQGGDPEGTGRGGPGYRIQDEEVVGRYGRGIVAMARTPEPNSQGSQFFIVLDDGAEPPLESARTYAIFGRVVEGMDVVDEIVASREASDLIEDPVRILSASVEQVVLPPEPTPAPTPVPTPTPPPTAAELAAQALGERIPDEIAGIPLEPAIFNSGQIITNVGRGALVDEITVLAGENGGDIRELSIAQASANDVEGTFVSVLAASVPGVPANLLQDHIIQIVLGDVSGASSETETIAGQQITTLRASEADDANTIRIFSHGDIVWFMVTSNEIVEEAVQAVTS